MHLKTPIIAQCLAIYCMVCAFGAARADASCDYLITAAPAASVYRVTNRAGVVLWNAPTAQEAGDRVFAVAKSGVVRFGEGRFRGQWTIRGTDGLTIEGVPGKTIIECPNTYATSLIIGKQGAMSTENKNITVRNLYFDVRIDSGSGGAGIILSACDHFLLENLTFEPKTPMEDETQRAERAYARTMGLTVWTPTQAPSRYGTVKNCQFLSSTLTCGGLKDVRFENLYFTGEYKNSNSLIDVSFGEVGPAALLENVSFKNIVIDRPTGHWINEHGERRPLDSLIGGFEHVRNVSFDSVEIDGGPQRTSAFHYYEWLKMGPLVTEGIRISRCTVRNVHELANIPRATFENCTFHNYDLAIDAPDVVVERCLFDGPQVGLVYANTK